MPAQLILPLDSAPALGREDFIVSPANAQAVAFVDSYPDWALPLAALYGPAGSGKSHLVRAWAARAHAPVIGASALDDLTVSQLPAGPVAIEDVDAAPPETRDTALFAISERGSPLVMTGREPPALWPVLLPDLASRFRAVLAFPLWSPDDALLAALARKLFADRQLRVPDSVVTRMIASLERSPGAIRDFIARLDARALAEKRKITAMLVRELIPPGP